MFPDLVDLREFYHSSTGQKVKTCLEKNIFNAVGDISKQDFISLGYGIPYLDPFLGKTNRTINLMPDFIGGMPWPEDEPNLSVIASPSALPFPDLFFDCALMVHYLEHAANIHEALREAWRILGEHGKLIMVIPNRKGIWARRDTSPFGSGRPYTKRQILSLLKETCFTPLRVTNALYMLPITKDYTLSLHGLMEKMGPSLFKSFSGVLIIEAQKQIYGVTPLLAPAKPQKLKAKAALSMKKVSKATLEDL